MTKILVAAIAGAMLGFGILATGAAQAAPASAVGLETPHSGVQTAQMRRRRAVRRSMRGRRMGYGAARPSQAGNARNPERPIRQQNQGQTTGGPRY